MLIVHPCHLKDSLDALTKRGFSLQVHLLSYSTGRPRKRETGPREAVAAAVVENILNFGRFRNDNRHCTLRVLEYGDVSDKLRPNV